MKAFNWVHGRQIALDSRFLAYGKVITPNFQLIKLTLPLLFFQIVGIVSSQTWITLFFCFRQSTELWANIKPTVTIGDKSNLVCGCLFAVHISNNSKNIKRNGDIIQHAMSVHSTSLATLLLPIAIASHQKKEASPSTTYTTDAHSVVAKQSNFEKEHISCKNGNVFYDNYKNNIKLRSYPSSIRWLIECASVCVEVAHQ